MTPPADAATFTGGAGPDLVLLHGLGSRWQVFAPVLDRLTRDHRVLAFDLPGFGARPVDATLRAGVAGYADWVTEQLLARDIRSPHVVGSSLGGGVALELARRGVAGRVTVFSPIGFWSTPERAWCQGVLTALRRAAQRFARPLSTLLYSRGARRMLLFPLFGRPTRVDPRAAIADLDALAAAPGFAAARDALQAQGPIPPSAVVPTVIAWGRRDLVLPFVTQQRRARGLHPRARHIALGGCGHLPFSDKPATCAAIITGTHPFTSRPTPEAP